MPEEIEATRSPAPRPAKALRRRAALAASTLAAMSLAGLFVVGSRIDHAFARELWLARASGYVALACLGLALSASSLARVAEVLGRAPRSSVVVAWRRGFGITTAWVVGLHLLVTATTYLWDSLGSILSVPYLRAGALAGLVLGLLLATSFEVVLRRLRIKLWKPLHRLAYPAALLVFQHMMLGPFASRTVTLGLFAGLFVIGSLRWLPRRSGPEHGSGSV